MALIALVDDDPQHVVALEQALTARGHQVVHYSLVENAMYDLLEKPPQLVISESELSDGSGLELVARLRNIRTADQLPVMIISTHGSESNVIRGFAAGADDYLIKPVTPAMVQAKVARLLSQAAAALPNPLPELGSRFADQYEIVKGLGEGSFGAVYEALTRGGQRVALKVMTSTAAQLPENRLRFLRETYALSAVRSPYLVQVHDFGDHQGSLYCALEYIDGPTLNEKVGRGGPGSEADIVGLLTGMGHALAALGDADLLHRDIKPGNVVLREGRFDAPVLLDFGLAKRPHDHGLTTPDMLFGTAGYMAPEYVAGDTVDHRADLFAVGVLGYYVAEGHAPFPDLHGLQLITAMSEQPVPTPRDIAPALRLIFRRLLALKPKDRYPDARALLSALDRLRPLASTKPRTGSTARRRTRLFAAPDEPTVELAA